VIKGEGVVKFALNTAADFSSGGSGGEPTPIEPTAPTAPSGGSP
jgi:hypothetical protein